MIQPDQWEHVRALFHQALDLPPDERDAFVRVRSDDPVVLAEVRSLLGAQPGVEADDFLSTPPGADQVAAAVCRLAPGTRLGAFEVDGLIGAGGMGEVYRARDIRLDRTVAIKVLAHTLVSGAHGRERFEREAHLISQLNHPHICTVHDVGSATIDNHDVPFLVMEFLDGETLAARLRRGPLPVQQALAYGREMIDALASAHALGIVHRDVKPANIMVTRTGVKLLDFGLARLRPLAPATGTDGHAVSRPDTLTDDGLVLGTMPYMAPEQVRGGDTDARTDIFAFGAVLYEMLTGHRAFDAPSQPALIAAILEHQPPPASREQPEVPAAVDFLLAGCLAKAPGDRWRDTNDIALTLHGIVERRFDPAASMASALTPTRATVAHRAGDGRWSIHAAWLTVVAIVGLGMWLLPSATATPAVAENARPVIVLMDSPLPGRVYDSRTLAAGGTNADDVSDALRDLPVLTYKENTSPIWHRETQVHDYKPDLVISHLSALLDQRFGEGDGVLNEHLFNIAQSRLIAFFGYMTMANPRTRFLIYSRGRLWPDAEAQEQWTRDAVARFPRMSGRLFTMTVPGRTTASFRDPATAAELRNRVSSILGLR